MSGNWKTVAVREEQVVLLRAIHLATGESDSRPTRVTEDLLARYLKRKLKDFDIEALLKKLSKAEGLTYDHLDFDQYK